MVRALLLAGLVVGLLSTAAAGVAYLYFASRLEETMSTRKWDLPSRLHPAALTLEPGRRLPPGPLDRTLEAMGYLKAKPVQNPGEYREAAPGRFYVRARAGWPGLAGVVNQTLELELKDGVLTGLRVFKGRALRKAVIPPVAFAEIRSPDQETRRLVRYKDFPRILINAVIAIEDKRFYQHFGIDPRGLVRALVVNLVRGGRAQGGSTLTQQLAKNYFLTHEKTLPRKLKELFYALALERKYSKEQVLELYLNEIYLGQRGGVAVSGMGQAAYAYFSRDVRELKLEEAALLAGLIQSPNAYAPDRHKDKAKARRNQVLARMLEQGYITRDAYQAAIKKDVTLHPGPYVRRTAPYFVDYVGEQVGAQFPDTSFSVEGYTLETTLDMRVQQIAEKALAEGLASLDHATRAPLEGAVVALDPQTGRILAMVGGRSYGSSQFNRVTLARRQPGSVIKPLVVLAAIQARGHELGPTTVLKDEPLTVRIDGKDWSPQNFDKQFHGDVTLRTVLEQSLNVPTVRLADDIGLQRVVELLRALRITEPLKPLPSLALGAFELSPLEVATAFTALATPGVLHTPYGIERVLDRDGRTLYEGGSEQVRVVAPTEAYLVRDMMRGVIERGTGKAARAQGYSFEAAGKTGTTNDFKDAWFVGFDSDLLVVVWVGSDQPIPTGFTGGKAALPIWTAIMKHVRQTVPPAADPPPGGLARVQVCAESLELPVEACPLTESELFWSGTEPTDHCHVHSGFIENVGDAVHRLPGLLKQLFSGNQD